ncbi:MAG TPA: hypothetical protein VIM73_05280, partial [Polyangiaceae bacterium]
MGAKKILLLVFGSVAGGLLALGVAAAVLVPRWVEERVLAEARRRGVELVPGDISFGLRWVQVTNASATLIGVPGLKLTADAIHADLSDYRPVRLTLARVHVEATGDALDLARQLRAWALAHGQKTPEPLLVKPLSFVARPEEKGDPSIRLDDAELRVETKRAALTAKRASLLGRDIGELRAIAEDERFRAAATFGERSLDNPALSLEVARDGVDTLHVALAPVTLGRLGKLLGSTLPHPDVTLAGTLTARIPNNVGAGGKVTGEVAALLKGYVPPHPVELDGFVFGDTTAMRTLFTLDVAELRILFEQTAIRAGRFELSGGGEARATGLDATFSLLLNGNLPCDALAGAAAETRLGRALGGVAGKAARQLVAGRVGVRVAIEGRASEPERALVLKTITPGCGLKPLTLKELVKLGDLVPEALDPAVARDIEKLLQKNL